MAPSQAICSKPIVKYYFDKCRKPGDVGMQSYRKEGGGGEGGFLPVSLYTK